MAERKIKRIKFEVKRKLGSLPNNSQVWKKELNLVSWDDREPVYDLRLWKVDTEQPGKGITLTKEELKELVMIIKDELRRLVNNR